MCGQKPTTTSIVSRAVVLFAVGMLFHDAAAGKTPEDKPCQKSKDGFGAMLMLTEKAEELFAAWEKPSPGVGIHEVDTARAGLPISGVIFFAGCAADKSGKCDAVVDFTVYSPDGSVYGEQKGSE